MIPSNGFLPEDFVIVEQSSKTFYLDINRNVVYGYTDGQDAMRQAIYLILSTERYQYIIFSRNYGIELLDLYGKQMTYVLPELERRITEALLQDTRIKSLENFSFAVARNAILTTFTAVTIHGEIPIEKAVAI